MENIQNIQNIQNFENIENLVSQIFALCKQYKIRLTTAESCTGGLIAEVLTRLSGASEILDCAFVVYNEKAKIQLISVPPEIIQEFGVVSEQCAEKMAFGAVKKSPNANIGISTTGVAGPTGGDTKNPVGTVCFALYFENSQNPQIKTFRKIFDGNRQQIRQQATLFILMELLNLLKDLQK